MKRFMLQFVDLTIFSIQTLLVCVEEFSYLTLVIIQVYVAASDTISTLQKFDYENIVIS